MNLTRAGFTAWLNEQDRLDVGHCPIEHYLGVGWKVGKTLYYRIGGHGAFDLPFWAVRFICALDIRSDVYWLNTQCKWYSARGVEETLASIPDDEIAELKQAA